MALFGKEKPETSGLIGVDFGGGGIKLVELIPRNGRMTLGSYAYSELKEGEELESILLDQPKVSGALVKKLMEDSGMASTKVNAALPSHEIFHAIISIPQPKNEKEDIQPMIEKQVKKFLPIPIEQMVLDTTVIDKDLLPKKAAPHVDKKGENSESEALKKIVEEEKSIAGKHVRVLVSGASRELVSKYIAVFKEAGLELVALETEAFALIRSMIGKDKSKMMIVDIGYERTNITIIKDGIPFLHRSIRAGGRLVTDMISQKMGIDLADAEQAKQDLAMSSSDNDEMPEVLNDAIAPIIHEVKYSLELYNQQGTDEIGKVEKIIITGGSAHLPGITKFMEKALDINVYLGDPWARVISPEGLKPVLDEIGPRFSVAIGLAMKDIYEKHK